MGKSWENHGKMIHQNHFFELFFLAKKIRQSHNSEYIPHGRGTSLAPSPMASVTGEGSTVLRMNSTNSACQLHHIQWEYYGNIYIHTHSENIMGIWWECDGNVMGT